MMDFQAARFLVEGTVPPQAGNDHPYSTPMGVFPTKDGHINIAVAADGQWRRFCQAIGRHDLAEDPDYEDNTKRFARRPALRAAIEATLGTMTSAEVLAALEEAGVPAGPIYQVDEVFLDPQVRHLGIAELVRHPLLGDIRLVGEPVALSRTPAKIDTPTPEPGEHTRELLEELGFDEAAVARLRTAGAV
jgi:crotonobetainyl-CoA:carnitine CoA-transferase CaiB-like acyl-CoA transferase